jgi:hypothetical protein
VPPPAAEYEKEEKRGGSAPAPKPVAVAAVGNMTDEELARREQVRP